MATIITPNTTPGSQPRTATFPVPRAGAGVETSVVEIQVHAPLTASGVPPPPRGDGAPRKRESSFPKTRPARCLPFTRREKKHPAWAVLSRNRGCSFQPTPGNGIDTGPTKERKTERRTFGQNVPVLAGHQVNSGEACDSSSLSELDHGSQPPGIFPANSSFNSVKRECAHGTVARLANVASRVESVRTKEHCPANLCASPD